MKKELIDVLNKLENNGFQAYIVGGYVRDYILNKETTDVDIATDATIDDLLKIFYKDVKLINKQFGNVVVNDIEITTFRKDEYNNSRFPRVEYVKSIQEDVLRRDFTINALYMNKKFEIIDMIGGMNDIQNKIIKTIKDPNISFDEDPLRIIRAIRFAKSLNFNIDEDTLKAINKYSYKLKEINRDRIKREIEKGYIFGVFEKEYEFVLKK